MKNLILYPIESKSVDLYENIKDKNRSFDFACIYYGNDEAVKAEIEDKCAVFLTEGWNKIRKWDMIYRCFQDKLDFFHNYEYIWIPDNDMKITNSDIEIMFKIASESKLDLCQPSIKGDQSHPQITNHQEGIDIIKNDFIEVMCPLFSKNTLFKCFSTFSGAETGWGLDYTWAHFLDKKNIGVIHKVFATHTRPRGQNYSNFDQCPWQEMSSMQQKYGY